MFINNMKIIFIFYKLKQISLETSSNKYFKTFHVVFITNSDVLHVPQRTLGKTLRTSFYIWVSQTHNN